MFPIIIVVLLLGGVAYAATRGQEVQPSDYVGMRPRRAGQYGWCVEWHEPSGDLLVAPTKPDSLECDRPREEMLVIGNFDWRDTGPAVEAWITTRDPAGFPNLPPLDEFDVPAVEPPHVPEVDPIVAPEDDQDVGIFEATALPNPMFWRLKPGDRLAIFGEWYWRTPYSPAPVESEFLSEDPRASPTFSIRGNEGLDALLLDVVWHPWKYPPEQGGGTVLRQLMLIEATDAWDAEDWIEVGQQKFWFDPDYQRREERDEPLHQFVILGPG